MKLDTYSVEYAFANDTKLFLHTRPQPRCREEFAPDVDKLTMDSPAPVQAGANGRYPEPQPGRVTDREF